MTHDLPLLIKAAQLAEGAYNTTIEGAKKYENKRTDTTAFLLKSPNIDYVVWRGTESRRDWLYNLLFIPRPVKNAWIHTGFYRHLQGVWKEIRLDLNPAKKTIFIGHSLGGGAAECAAHLCREFRNLHLITFGKPNTFAKFKPCRLDHLKTHYSIVNGSDIVARIPRIGYRPSSGDNLCQLWFANDGRDLVNPDTATKREDWKAKDSVADHLMGGYRSRLDTFCGTQIEEEYKEEMTQKSTLRPPLQMPKNRKNKKRRK